MSNSPNSPSARRGSRLGTWLLVVLLLLLIVAGGGGWLWWQAQRDSRRALAADTHQRWQALDARLEALVREQRSYGSRLQQVEDGHRVLREALLGIGQRSARIEDRIDRLARPARPGAEALRLDEVELLLAIGLRRLQIAGDPAGARQAYALAADALEQIDDPAYLPLRQTLARERVALDALGNGPRAQALAALETFTQALAARRSAAARAAAAPRDGEADADAPWWRRLFGRFIEVQPSDHAAALPPADRAAARAGLQLELSLARAAAERGDVAAWRTALQRAERWLQRLAPGAAANPELRARLQGLAAMPLSPALPALGSTLAQLRQLRASRTDLPPPSPRHPKELT